MEVLEASDLQGAAFRFEYTFPVVIIGGGACGMVAALAAAESGAKVLIVERDATPRGSTAMSSGMIPACNTRFQREKQVVDSVDIMVADLQKKNKGLADPQIVKKLCDISGPTIEWLVDRYGINLQLVEGFIYPGHSVLRMHAPPSKTGAELINRLTQAVKHQEIEILTDTKVETIYVQEDRIVGISGERPDGSIEKIGCQSLILACGGFGGNAEMVKANIPEMENAVYHGHDGNIGHAVHWGRALGAATKYMTACQGHGSLATPFNELVTWALMMEGGIQVNLDGQRFSNEHQGYSEQAVFVLEQKERVAWNIYDKRIDALGKEFEEYNKLTKYGAVLQADSIDGLAQVTGLNEANLKSTLNDIEHYATGKQSDPFKRNFSLNAPLAPPYFAIKVTGAIFHTQGGLDITSTTQVKKEDGSVFPNLFAGGGAACGVSGPKIWGYLSGNGLLTAVMMGRTAGYEAAKIV